MIFLAIIKAIKFLTFKSNYELSNLSNACLIKGDGP
jgi:hypothetical protein